MLFAARERKHPSDNATPTFRVPNKSWDPGLSAEVSFNSVLAMVLSENWKRLEGFLFVKFHHFYEIAEIICFKKFSPAFFNTLKESLLVQKQTIHQLKALDLSFYLAPWKWVWHPQDAATPSRREKYFLLNFRAARRVFDFLPSMRAWQPHGSATPTSRKPN